MENVRRQNIKRRTPIPNLKGRQFTYLTVLERAPDRIRKDGYPDIMWKCQCKCGNIVVVQDRHLLNGDTKSCGCWSTEVLVRAATTHDMSRTRIYNLYHNIVDRCYRKGSISYSEYGGRGIYICNEWYTPGVKGNPGFVNFYNWSINNGYNDLLSIDRIDNDGPYAPWNCRWVSERFQQYNKPKVNFINTGDKIIPCTIYEYEKHLPRGYIRNLIKNCDWSNSAVVYAIEHPELGIKKIKGEYRDKNGFIVLIPNIPDPTHEQILDALADMAKWPDSMYPDYKHNDYRKYTHPPKHKKKKK